MTPGTRPSWRAERAKRRAELRFWRERLADEGELTRGHYEHLFTTMFELDGSFYEGKRILDVGCGPRGSLEWASMAAVRVGVDPLAREYERLHRRPHAMTYVQAGAEKLPFPDGAFDVVATLNSLDHVRSLDPVLSELARVCRPGGMLLLAVEVNHEPTVTEPHAISWDVLDRLAPAFEPELVRRVAKSNPTMYGSVLAGEPYTEPDGVPVPGILWARLRRR